MSTLPGRGEGPARGARGLLQRAALRAALLVAISFTVTFVGIRTCKAAASDRANPAAFNFVDIGSAPGHRVTAASVHELQDALLDERVTQVAMLPNGSWNFSREAWGSEPVLLHRPLMLTGVPSRDGQPPYVDAKQLAELVVVGANGSLHVRRLFLDDCLLPAMPLVCLVAATTGGSLLLDTLVFGDASCTNIRHSAATNWILRTSYQAAWRSGWSPVDERSVHVADTGEVRSAAEGVRWRFVNTTFRCTGNETQALLAAGSSGSSEAQMALSALATVLALLAGLTWLMNHGVVYAQAGESAEEAAARAMGIVLLGVIGKGTCGKVFRARYEGRTVAVKAVRCTDANGRAAAEVANEHRHALACSHPCIAACLTHTTVQVRADIGRLECLRASWYMPFSRGHPLTGNVRRDEQRRLRQQLRQQQWQQRLGSEGHLAGSSAGTTTPPGHPIPRSPALGAASAGWAAPDSSSSSSSRVGELSSDNSTSSGMLDSVVSLLVMEHCPLGSLHQAIAAGRFHSCQSGPNLDWVLRTGLDVALALQYLHSECNIVHRDVSTNNILLTPDPSDFRGFRARLSDFGLSVELVGSQAYTTSQLKGTVHFMPPEVFTSGEVHFALDLYSLGITLYWMVAGEGPFAGLAPYEVVGKKLEEAYSRQRLDLPSSMPPELQALVWDCTHWDPRQRPTAGAAARRLAGLICKLGQNAGRGGKNGSKFDGL